MFKAAGPAVIGILARICEAGSAASITGCGVGAAAFDATAQLAGAGSIVDAAGEVPARPATVPLVDPPQAASINAVATQPAARKGLGAVRNVFMVPTSLLNDQTAACGRSTSGPIGRWRRGSGLAAIQSTSPWRRTYFPARQAATS
jgi:hypothetical protein